MKNCIPVFCAGIVLVLSGCVHPAPLEIAAKSVNTTAQPESLSMPQLQTLAAKYLAKWVRTNPRDAVWTRTNKMEVIPTRGGWDVIFSYSPDLAPEELRVEGGYRYLVVNIRKNGEFFGVEYGHLIF